MPVKKLNFSFAPINDNPVSLDSGGKFQNGFSHKNGFPTIKFSIPAQDVLLDVGNLYLSGQFLVVDKDGNAYSTNDAGKANYNVNNGSATISQQNCLNKSNWNGVQSVIDKVVVQSKKTQTELQTIINYAPYNALKMGYSYNEDDYRQVPSTRMLCSGRKSGFSDRHYNNTPATGESRLSGNGDKYCGNFFSMKLDIALLNAQMIHLGNDFSGGLLLTLHLSPDANVFHSRFRSINAGTTNADPTGASYILKHIRLEGKYAVPDAQDLQSYNPVLTMNSRVNLMNDIVSSENANSFTPQLQMVKGIVNTFLDEDQQNNYLANTNNFRPPLGIEEYQHAKNNIRYPYDYQVKVEPNAQTTNTIGSDTGAPTPTFGDMPAARQGDAELRLQMNRAMTGGINPSHHSATIELTNENLKQDYDASTATATDQVGNNTFPDLLGIGVDYANNIGQIQNYVNQDYELKVKSGVNTGRATLPAHRRDKIEVQESFLRNFSQIDLRTLQKVQ